MSAVKTPDRGPLDGVGALQERANDAVTNPSLDKSERRELNQQLNQIDEAAATLQHGEITEFLGRYIRNEYRSDDRVENLCDCPNHRCPFKRGRMHPKFERFEGSPRQRLKKLLEFHPDAVVLDEALDEFDDMVREVKSAYRSLISDAREAAGGEVPSF